MHPSYPNIFNDSNSRRCAACKYLRRRCAEDCILSPYFPASHPHRFACVHRIFGASNVARVLQQLPDNQRVHAANSISSEAYWRVQDPVYGSAGIINLLQHEIYRSQQELARIQAQLAMYPAQSPAQPGALPEISFHGDPRQDNPFDLQDTTLTDYNRLQNLN